ncbi:DHH family phosphoesterase [Candidatus Woesearchaeota archaeon]|nr:DHH family phosphoesterase [Candidatus Woesearchaeota archaeon]
MQLKNKNLEEKTILFLKNLEKKDKIAIMHHSDPDGVCSGVLISKIIERLRDKPIDLRYNQHSNEHAIQPQTVKLLKKYSINKLITTDICSEENKKKLEEVEDFAKILIIDHHRFKHDANSEKTIMFKPQLVYEGIEPSKYCSAKLVYDLGEKCSIFMKDLDWIASIGIVADMAFQEWEEFLKNTAEKYGIEKNNWWEGKFGKASNLINDTECFNDELAKESFYFLSNARNIRDFLSSPLIKYQNIIQEEVDNCLSSANEKAEHYSELELVYYEIKPKYKVKSSISTLISMEKPNTTFIIVDLSEEYATVSGRRLDGKIAMNELFEYATKDITEAHGGGHVNSGGATVPKKSYALFKQRIFEYLKNYLLQ